MVAHDLRALLDAIPEPSVEPSDAALRGIDESVAYLDSEAALASIAADPYVPKWNGPWWRALLLFELGEAARIPAHLVAALSERLNALPVRSFPIQASDFPAGLDPDCFIPCHCAVGSIAQVLAAHGEQVTRALPWVVPWFPRYQMADGGLNCDASAYLVQGECPSSMVGTISPFEAMRVLDVPGRAEFVARAAQFLTGRALSQGSSSVHNAEERVAARAWPELTFPRFYFYDTLRGLTALVAWAEESKQSLPLAAVAPTAVALAARFPDGVALVERRAFDRAPSALNAGQPARASFPLLDAVSVIGSPSPALTRQWTAARRGLLRLLAAGRIVDAH